MTFDTASQSYLDEFVFRFNRRRSRCAKNLRRSMEPPKPLCCIIFTPSKQHDECKASTTTH